MKNTTTLALACSAAFLGQVGISCYLPAVPAIAHALPAAEDQVALALAVYLVGMALPMLLWGSLGERFGRKPVLLGALAVYALTSAAIPSAFNIESFLALRLVQGLGAGGVSVMARVLVRDSFSGALLAKGLSWLGMTFVIALGIGQFAGSVLQVAFGWEAILCVGNRRCRVNAGVAAGGVCATGKSRFVGIRDAHLRVDCAPPGLLARRVGRRVGLWGDHRVQHLCAAHSAGPF